MASVYSVGAAGGGALSADSRRDVEKAYRAALLHSRHVRWLRYGVIVGIAAVMVGVVVANFLPTGGLRLPGDIGSLVIKGTKITMQEPRLKGFTTDSRPYEFTADTAAQDITQPDIVEMQHPKAKIEMVDKSTVIITALSGTYDMKAEMLTLTDNIHLVSSTGYEGRLTEAVIDVRKGDVVSEKPVWVKLLNGFINANRLEVVENGSMVRFGGGVSMTLLPNKDAKAPKP